MGLLTNKKTMKEVEYLQENWIGDPSWDIEDTEGFEEWHDYLMQWRKQYESKWAAKEDERLKTKAKALGCSIELVGYIEALERRIKVLENE